MLTQEEISRSIHLHKVATFAILGFLTFLSLVFVFMLGISTPNEQSYTMRSMASEQNPQATAQERLEADEAAQISNRNFEQWSTKQNRLVPDYWTVSGKVQRGVDKAHRGNYILIVPTLNRQFNLKSDLFYVNSDVTRSVKLKVFAKQLDQGQGRNVRVTLWGYEPSTTEHLVCRFNYVPTSEWASGETDCTLPRKAVNFEVDILVDAGPSIAFDTITIGKFSDTPKDVKPTSLPTPDETGPPTPPP